MVIQIEHEIKNANSRGYHYSGERRYINVPTRMFKVYIAVAMETILAEQIQIQLGQTAFKTMMETIDNLDAHKATLKQRVSEYLASWSLYTETNKPRPQPEVETAANELPMPELDRSVEHTPLKAPELKQTEMEPKTWDAKELGEKDDGIKLFGPQPNGVKLFVPRQNCDHLRTAVRTRADGQPARSTKSNYCTMLELFDKHVLKGKRFETIVWNFDAFKRWVAKFPAHKRAKYEAMVNDRTIGEYEALDRMRPTNKELTVRSLFCKMEALYKQYDLIDEYAENKARLIISSEDIVNVYYGPIFDQVKRNFKACLKDTKFVYTDGNTPQENANLVNDVYQTGMDICENDFSKYDRTQGEWLRKAEFQIFDRLGLESQDAENWGQTTKSEYTSYMYGFKMQVDYQRQTGDPTTSLGNSITNLITSLQAYYRCGVDIEEDISLMMFLGDDNLTLMSGGLMDAQRTKEFENTMTANGLQAKYFVKRSLADAEYCSNGFITKFDGRVVSLPKIGKALARLNVRSKYHSAIIDEVAMCAKRASWALANANNPLGRAAKSDHKVLLSPSLKHMYRTYELQLFARRISEVNQLPFVTDDEMKFYLRERYGDDDLQGLLDDISLMTSSNQTCTFEPGSVLREALAVDM